MTKKSFSFNVIIIIMAGAMLLSCSQNKPLAEATNTPPATVSPVNTKVPSPTLSPTEIVMQGSVRLWHSWGEREMPALNQILAKFKILFPDVLFDILYVPVEDMARYYEIEAGQGGGPCILAGPAEWGPMLYDAGLIIDMGEFIPDELVKTLNQPAVGAAIYRGAQIGLPYSVQGVVLYRNKTIITRKPETFDDLISLAQFATQGAQIGAVLERSFYYSGGHLEGIGGKLMDEDGNPAFNSPEGQAWLELLSEFELAGPPNFFSGEDVDYFIAGNVGWIIDGTWNLPMLAETIGVQNLVIDEWPSYDRGLISGSLSGFVQSENLYVNSSCTGPELNSSLEFISYFLSPDAQIHLTEIGRIPASSDVQIVDITTGHLINGAIAALGGGTTYPVTPLMDLYAVQLDVALKSYFDGTPAEEALQAAEDTIQRQVDQAQALNTPEP